jgi:hypothetical protein
MHTALRPGLNSDTALILNDVGYKFGSVQATSNGKGNLLVNLDPNAQRNYQIDNDGNVVGDFPELSQVYGGGPKGTVLYDKGDNQLYYVAGACAIGLARTSK